MKDFLKYWKMEGGGGDIRVLAQVENGDNLFRK